MIAFNHRLNERFEIASIDFTNGKVKLVQPNTKFIYTEKLSNIEILEDTGVKLDDVSVYVNDVVTDGKEEYKVQKVPGGYYPFMVPNNKNFKKV